MTSVGHDVLIQDKVGEDLIVLSCHPFSPSGATSYCCLAITSPNALLDPTSRCTFIHDLSIQSPHIIQIDEIGPVFIYELFPIVKETIDDIRFALPLRYSWIFNTSFYCDPDLAEVVNSLKALADKQIESDQDNLNLLLQPIGKAVSKLYLRFC